MSSGIENSWENFSYNFLGQIFGGLYGLTTPNASPIEQHVNCLNSAGRFHHFSPY